MSHDSNPPTGGRVRRPHKLPTVTRFEERSLALFAALAIGAWSVPARAQPHPTETVRTASAAGGFVPAAGATASHGVRAAFVRADTNGDGLLSRDESARLPAVHERFNEIDTDHDQQLSPEEFYKGVADN